MVLPAYDKTYVGINLYDYTPLHYFLLSDHYILSREWRVIVGQVQTTSHDFNQSAVAKLLIMRNPHHGRMCFKSVKTLGVLHS